MSSIPEEIIYNEILVRLPVKSLLKCKSVCKNWYALISNSDFVKLHFHFATLKNNPILMLEGPSGKGLCSIGYESLTSSVFEFEDMDHPFKSDMDHPFKSLRYFVQLMGSCNGLVCIMLVVSNDDGHKKYHFYIWNPATREYKGIPESPIKIYMIQMSALVYDHNTDDYKLVIGTRTHHRSKDTLVQVYSLVSNSWKPGQIVPCWFPNYYMYMERHGVLFNGDLHWLVMAEDKFSLLSLSVSGESFKELYLLLPKGLLEKNKQPWMSLGVLEGCLCLCVLVTSNVDDAHVFEVWQMLDYGVQESWTRRFIIPLKSVFESGVIFLSLLWSFENGEILFMTSKNLVMYDPEHGSARKLSKPSNISRLTVNYIESLVPLESGKNVGGEGRIEELRET